jgi:hypothetical protein
MAKDEISAAETEEVATESETSTDQKDVGTTEEQGKTSEAKSDKDYVPYDRFKEVIDQKNEFKEKLDQLESVADQRAQELSQMVDLLQARETDTQLVNAIRALAADGNPQHRELVESLDKVLQGLDDAVETGEKTPEQADKETKAAIAETKEAMEDIAADQQAELLLMKADLLAEKYFDALPPEYSDQDKEVISTLLTDKVNWEAIEEDPNVLSEEIPKAFEQVLQFFGEPRGKAAEVATEGETKQPAKEAAPEPEVPEHLKVEWGELKEVKTPKGSLLKPTHSDDDFSDALAKELRRMREGG